MQSKNQDLANLEFLQNLFPDTVLKPLEGKFVLIKKFKNNITYVGKHRRRGSKLRTDMSNEDATIFQNELEAGRVMQEINFKRKKNKVKMDKAENHFLVRYLIYDDYSKPLTLQPQIIPLSKYKQKKPKLFENRFDLCMKECEKDIERKQTELYQLQNKFLELKKLQAYDFEKLIACLKTNFQKNIEILYGLNK